MDTRLSRVTPRLAATLAAVALWGVGAPTGVMAQAPGPEPLPLPNEPAPVLAPASPPVPGPAPTAIADAGDQPADIPALIRDLGAADFRLRETSTARLCEVGVSPEDIVRQVPADTGLTVEQWSRLETALTARFILTPRGALGTGLQRADGQPDVVLSMVMPTFPSAEWLQIGDMIVAADGEALPRGIEGNLLLRAAILSHDPGETIQLVVVREGKRVEMRVPLGCYDDLEQPGQLHPDLIRRAFDLRRVRLGLPSAPASPPITPRLADASWPVAEAARGLAAQLVGVIAGGRPGAESGNNAMRKIAAARDAMIAQNRAELLRKQNRENARRPLSVGERRADLRQQIIQEAGIIESMQMQLRSGRLTPEERTAAMSRIEQSSARMQALQDKLRLLEPR